MASLNSHPPLASCRSCRHGHTMQWQGITAAGAMGLTALQHGARQCTQSVRTASSRYYYSSTSQHGLQEEEKELPPLDFKIFSWFLLVGPDGTDALIIIITIERYCHHQGHSSTRSPASTILHTIPTKDNCHCSHCCIEARHNGVVVEARHKWDHLGSGVVAHTSCMHWSTHASQSFMVLCCPAVLAIVTGLDAVAAATTTSKLKSTSWVCNIEFDTAAWQIDHQQWRIDDKKRSEVIIVVQISAHNH